MLEQLYIQNYAIIDEINIRFTEGLNIITGETGAGKSILMGALGLILGERADTQVLMEKGKKCIVEGHFSIGDKPAVLDFLEISNLESSAELILRREIGDTGKSRAFINDTPVNLAQLQELSLILVDLHQQFDAQSISGDKFQLGVLDALAENNQLLAAYKNHFQNYISLSRELLEKKEQQDRAAREQDYDQFIYSELEKAAFRENEIENLESELKQLTHAGQVKSVLGKICYALKESDPPMVSQIRSMQSQLQSVEEFHPRLAELAERLGSVQVELKDIADELDQVESSVRLDDSEIEKINERLNQGYRLMKKHGVHSTAGLLQLQKDISARIAARFSLSDEIASLEKAIEAEREKARSGAGLISAGRKAEIPQLEKQMGGLLKKVGMPNARFRVELATEDLKALGMDRVSFLFDANKSDRFEPLRKVASGGELSRLMLCIKSLVASSLEVPVLIFDEIDTGISGEAARQVGILMKELASGRQVISITHQPQIAAMADTHFLVYKKEQLGNIRTRIRELSMEERIDTVARMLGGEKPGLAAIANAREMINGHISIKHDKTG